MPTPSRDDGTDMDVRERSTVQTPRLYRLIMWNDDFTPMPFVVEMLVEHCGLGTEQAVAIMLDVHQKGKGTVGSMTREIAETRVDRIMSSSQEAGHPFRVTYESET